MTTDLELNTRASIANCRGSWVVGRSRGSWVWVKVVGNKRHLYTVSFPELDSVYFVYSVDKNWHRGGWEKGKEVHSYRTHTKTPSFLI